MSIRSDLPLSLPPTVDVDLLRELTFSRPWFHQIDLGHGIITPGGDPSSEKLAFLNLPASFAGKSVLDVGAFDGFFSFEAERRGAEKVLATDHYCWTHPEENEVADGRGFDIAHWALGSKVQKKVITVEEIGPSTVGIFDYVLFLGVLYHSQDPLRYLRNMASVCSDTLILETHVDGSDYDRPIMVFYPDNTLNDDRSNFWGPNRQCVVDMLREIGFREVTEIPPPVVAAEYAPNRAIFHAHR